MYPRKLHEGTPAACERYFEWMVFELFPGEKVQILLALLGVGGFGIVYVSIPHRKGLCSD
jgi:hypothetical protein